MVLQHALEIHGAVVFLVGVRKKKEATCAQMWGNVLKSRYGAPQNLDRPLLPLSHARKYLILRPPQVRIPNGSRGTF